MDGQATSFVIESCVLFVHNFMLLFQKFVLFYYCNVLPQRIADSNAFYDSQFEARTEEFLGRYGY